ncbi:30S ribosomal protein S18 [Candidatus Aerophobetes bacterium]|nr:30S ribosomal protein S18 [Candidatus Aerophobetes bacterium]
MNKLREDILSFRPVFKRRTFKRKKICNFCHSQSLDYLDIRVLQRYIDARARIRCRRRTGVCAKHQRKLSNAIKKAREMALLPYK